MQVIHILLGMLPAARVPIQTALSRDEIIHRLESNGVFRRSLTSARLAASRGDIAGRFKGARFVLTRKLGYHNSYQPTVRGQIHPKSAGSTVDIVFYSPGSYLILVVVSALFFLMRLKGVQREVWTRFVEIALIVHSVGVYFFFLEKGRIEQQIRNFLNSH